MERRGGRSTVEVTAEEVRTSLERTSTLTAEEEKVTRMRHGAALPRLDSPLASAAGNNRELGDELLLLEMQLMRAHRARTAARKPQLAVVEPLPPTKAKIVRALRRRR